MRLVKNSLPWLAIMMVSALVFGACAPALPQTPAPAGAAPSSAPLPMPSPTPAPAAVRGGVLTLRAQGALGSVDPLWPGGTAEARVSAPMYSRLLSLDKEDRLQPLLAKEWNVTQDGKVFTFNLRDDIKFHDGKPLTADDVVYSFKMTIDPPKGVISQHKGVFAPIIEKLEAVDPYTVRFTTKRAVGWFLSHVPIVQIAPKHAREPVEAQGGFKASGIGSGPFKFQSQTSAVEFRMVRNESYFKKGLPYLDEVRWAVIADDQATIAAFISGRVQHSGGKDFDQEMIDAVKAQREVVVEKFPRPIFAGIPFNFNNPQLAKKRVREALVLALDAKTINDVAYPGGRLPGSFFLGKFGIPPEERNQYAMFGFGKPPKDNWDTAKKILAEEGAANLQLSLLTYPGPHQRAAEIIQEMLGRVGVKAVLKVNDRAAMFALLAKGDYDIASPWDPLSAFGEPEHFVATAWVKSAPMGFSGRPPGYSNPKIDELYAQLQNTVDPDKRMEITRQVDRVLLEDTPAKLLGWFLGIDVFNPRVRGYVAKEVWHPARMLEEVWLAPQ